MGSSESTAAGAEGDDEYAYIPDIGKGLFLGVVGLFFPALDRKRVGEVFVRLQMFFAK